MHGKGSIPSKFKQVFTRVILVIAATGALQAAQAGCGKYQIPGGSAVRWDSYSQAPRFIHAGYQQVSDESPDWSQSTHHSGITGLWYFKYLSKGNLSLGIPDGAEVDAGDTIWFADGNEMTGSKDRAPATGNICFGTWKQTGEWTYELNHIGQAWDPVKNVYGGPAFIKQHVTLEKGGNKYAGTFDLKQYAPDGKTLDVEIKGLIVASRVTVDTDEQLP